MRPCFFVGANAVLEAQPDHDHDGPTGEVIGLPVQIEVEDGVRWIKSVWLPDADDVARIVAGGAVMFWLANIQPVCGATTIDADQVQLPA